MLCGQNYIELTMTKTQRTMENTAFNPSRISDANIYFQPRKKRTVAMIEAKIEANMHVYLLLQNFRKNTI